MSEHECFRDERFKNLEDGVCNLKKVTFGNGRQGLILDVHDLKKHVDEENERRRGRAAKNWAIYLLVISNILFFLRDMIQEFFK